MSSISIRLIQFISLLLIKSASSGVAIFGGDEIDETVEDGHYYFVIPSDPENITNLGSNTDSQSYSRRRPGRATESHSCNLIRGVPPLLRSARHMGPRGLGRFYQKYTEAYGIPVLGSRNARDDTLKRACYIVRFIFAGHSGVRQSFYSYFGRLAVIGAREQTTDIPEHSWLGSWWNSRARGLGATVSAPVSTAGEENFLCYTQDRYRAQDIGLHEYAHGVHLLGAKYAIKGWDRRLLNLYRHHRRTRRKWANTYSMSTKEELFAEGTQAYFNVQSYAPRPDGVRGPINTREKLKNYDLTLYNMIEEVFPCNNQYIKRCEKNRAKEMSQVLKMNCDKGSPVTRSPVTGGKSSSYRTTYLPTTIKTNKPIETCRDYSRHCRYWAGRRYCGNWRYSAYMKRNCRKACAICK